MSAATSAVFIANSTVRSAQLSGSPTPTTAAAQQPTLSAKVDYPISPSVLVVSLLLVLVCVAATADRLLNSNG